MSENRNCPNCGVPYDVGLSKCPYCGTSYFDLSCLQIDGDPFYLKIRTTDGLVITQKCILTSAQINIEPHHLCVTDRNGIAIGSFVDSTDMTTTLELQNIAEDGKLSTYYKEAI